MSLLPREIQFLIHLFVAILPVLAFLVTLVLLDSFKLIRFRAIILTLGVGSLVAVLCLFLNSFLIAWCGFDLKLYSRYLAPIIEELGKALYVVYLIKSNRVGFLVDGAIQG